MSGEDPLSDPDIEAYAALQMQLVGIDGEARAALLEAHGLNEDAYEALDDRAQEALSRALDATDAGVPPLVARYDAALKRAHEGLEPPLSLERFAEATIVLGAGGDPTKALAKIGVSLPDYLRSSQAWAGRLAKDDDLARRFAALMR